MIYVSIELSITAFPSDVILHFDALKALATETNGVSVLKGKKLYTKETANGVQLKEDPTDKENYTLLE